MIHQYKLNGYNIVLDVFSGSVHVVDEMTYDAVALLVLGKTHDEVRQALVSNVPRYNSGIPDGEEKYTLEDPDEILRQIDELKEQGKLFAEDIYEPKAFDFKSRSTVVKALCLHVAHTCNLNCSYCFAAQGKFHGKAGLMSFETGKRSLDYLVENEMI